MKKDYKLIIFDLDGTLLNTYEGIANAYKYAATKMNLHQPSKAMLSTAIGAPLKDVFIREYGISSEMADEAIKHYRHYYIEKGRHEMSLYEGIKEVLKSLKDKGAFLGVATLKLESFAKNMLEECGLLKYFDCVMGKDSADTLTKCELVAKCMEHVSALPEDSALIGDSSYDWEGAKKANVFFLGVSYGFGYKRGDVIEGGKVLGMADTPTEILKFF